jgi:hypothetical protein
LLTAALSSPPVRSALMPIAHTHVSDMAPGPPTEDA